MKHPQKTNVKAYNMAILGESSAEINMYGDVVMSVPTDFWTGEKLEGNFIAVDEFLEDLEAIKEKSQITVHINSGGGDLYAGLAIYNRLKTCSGQVITINDGLAASAACLIFQAGDVRQMNSGSNLMAHGVSGFLYGFYNVEDLKELTARFKAHNRAIVNVYAEAMGISHEEATKFVQGETWLTGQEAVEKGLADEVIEGGDDTSLEDSLMQKLIAKAGNVFKAQYPGTSAAITAAVPPIANKNSIDTGGNEDMDIKTVEELRNAFPDLVAQIENAAIKNAETNGAAKERARIQGIEEIENTISDKTLIKNAKYGENLMNAEQLALHVLKTQEAIGVTMLNNLKADADESGASGVTPTPAQPEGEPEKVDIEAEAKNAVEIFNAIKNGGKK